MIQRSTKTSGYWGAERWMCGVLLNVYGYKDGASQHILLTPGEARQLAAELNALAGKESPPPPASPDS